MTHPCECDLTDDHGEAAELRRRLVMQDARALVASAFEAAAQYVDHLSTGHGNEVRALTPEDAKTALDQATAFAFSAGYEAGERDAKAAALTAQPVAQEPVSGAPERVWMGAADADGDHDFWFDPDEGGTEYIRADLAGTTHFSSFGNELPSISAGFSTTPAPETAEQTRDRIHRQSDDYRAGFNAALRCGRAGEAATPAPVEAGLRELLDQVWNEAVEQAAIVARSCVHMTPDPDNAIRIMLNGREKLFPASAAALRAQSAPVGGEGGA